MWSESTAASDMPIEATRVVEAIVAIGAVDAGVAAASGDMMRRVRWASQGPPPPRNHTPKTTSLRASEGRSLNETTFARSRRQDAG